MPPSPQYLFHHIPKCGGNSLRIAFAQWFLITYDYRERPHRHFEAQTPADFAQNRLDRSNLRDHHLLCGHFDTEGAYLWQRYPAVYGDQTRLITFLRHPLERAISHYFYGRKTGRLPIKENSLEEFLLACQNPMAKLLSPAPENAWQILAPYWFVGTLENIDADLNEFARRLHRAPPVAQSYHVNQTSRPPYDLSPEILAIFKANNALDFALFERAAGR
ncbi:sulfotransferase family 2 domain-containing protein [Thalassospira marina]|uniref:Sulfotransferase family protein n=1 Tax=Thalassospira marina TaxID=2048283 RepID=A0ABM6Q8E4_9PROT|nr:sulfotransferase family 2 domain-containing protein [Thalassospira marina]AUG52728.1 hypothetical protein CSC3H3_08420 [Thalassospira marina]